MYILYTPIALSFFSFLEFFYLANKNPPVYVTCFFVFSVVLCHRIVFIAFTRSLACSIVVDEWVKMSISCSFRSALREYCDCIRKSHQPHLFHSSAVWDSGYCVDCAGKCIHDCMCSVVVHRHLAAELFEHRSKIIRDIDIALLLLCVLHVGFCCRLICISAWFHVYDQLHLPNCF